MSSIAGLLLAPGGPRLLYVLAHGAGAGMRHPFLEAVARVREAVAEAAHERPGVPLIAGGKSFGGRMTSGAQAAEPLPGVRGLVFLGFPLHPPGKPGVERAAHLEGRAAAEVIRELADALAVWADRVLGT